MTPVHSISPREYTYKTRKESRVDYIPESIMEKLQTCQANTSSPKRERAYMILSSYNGQSAREIRKGLITEGYKVVSISQIRKMIRLFNLNVNAPGFLDRYLQNVGQVKRSAPYTFEVTTYISTPLNVNNSLANTSMPEEVNIDARDSLPSPLTR